MRLRSCLAPGHVVVPEGLFNPFTRTVLREPHHLGEMWVRGRVGLVDVPESTTGDFACVGNDNLLPVTLRVMRVPHFQPGDCFTNGIFASLCPIPVDWKKDMEELLRRALM